MRRRLRNPHGGHKKVVDPMRDLNRNGTTTKEGDCATRAWYTMVATRGTEIGFMGVGGVYSSCEWWMQGVIGEMGYDGQGQRLELIAIRKKH